MPNDQRSANLLLSSSQYRAAEHAEHAQHRRQQGDCAEERHCKKERAEGLANGGALNGAAGEIKDKGYGSLVHGSNSLVMKIQQFTHFEGYGPPNTVTPPLFDVFVNTG